MSLTGGRSLLMSRLMCPIQRWWLYHPNQASSPSTCCHFYPRFYHSFDCGQVTTNPINPNPKVFFPSLWSLTRHFESESFPLQYLLFLPLLRYLSLHLLNTQASVVITFKEPKLAWHILFSGSEEKAFFLHQGVVVRQNPEL